MGEKEARREEGSIQGEMEEPGFVERCNCLVQRHEHKEGDHRRRQISLCPPPPPSTIARTSQATVPVHIVQSDRACRVHRPHRRSDPQSCSEISGRSPRCNQARSRIGQTNCNIE